MADARARVETSPQPGPMQVQAVFWNTLGHGSVAHALTELLNNMPENGVGKTLWYLGGSPLSPRPYFKSALSPLVYRMLCKVKAPAHFQGRVAGAKVLSALSPGDIMYVWPPYDIRLIKDARERGAIVVAERTNCMAPMGRERLVAAFARRGHELPPSWYTREEIAEEHQQMLACDYITAPNALVAQSLLESGIDQSRILDTFYGFDPVRLASAIDIDRPKRRPVFAFVGLGIVRKGFDVLLEAWKRADIDGTLLIAGNVDEDLRNAYADTLSRPDVVTLGYVGDIAEVYAAADVFVFPTHEEGGPQVVYEAAGCGLASIVSPMGTGRIVRGDIECLLVDPLSVDQLANAITRLATSEELRRSMGAAAAKRARLFTWSHAALHLYEKFRGVVDLDFDEAVTLPTPSKVTIA
ncbi:glycosyltransferase family 4 protein [Sphingomonas flavescens]|uniref:glycosyltransferase family 4 protein n=1 Tax=Sphingomonas flavescens TaxID=3132797 RepID=UPI002806159D|nr:glycosyltransferase family 4 protein [Sphingomonas limnosediminicola]